MNRDRRQRPTQLIALFIRSAPMRGLLVVAVLACAAATGASSAVAALTPTSEQARVSFLGGADALVEIVDGQQLPPGEDVPAPPRWLTEAGIAVLPVTGARVVSNRAPVDYYETHFPSPAFDRRTDLVSGRWPVAAGECALSNGASLRPALGDWAVRLTGEVLDHFEPHRSIALCGPGTWALWRLEAGDVALAPTATVSYYLCGDPSEVSKTVQRLRATPDLADRLSITASGDFTSSAMRATDVVGLFAPLSLLLMGAVGAMGYAFGAWSLRVGSVLGACGIPISAFRRALLGAVAGGATIAGGAGAGLGELMGWLARPALRGLRAGAPLAPWSFTSLPILVGLTVAVPGLIGALWSTRPARTSRKARAGGNERRRLRHAVAWGALAAAALMVALADGQLWLLLPSGLFVVLGAALHYDTVVARLATVIARRPLGHSQLAGRILADSSRKVQVTGTLIALMLGAWFYLLSLTIVSSATEQVLMTAPMPAGVARINPDGLDGRTLPARVVPEFEHDLSVQNPVSVAELAVVRGGSSGVVWGFDSIGDARRIVKGLTDADWQAFAGGTILTTEDFGDRVTIGAGGDEGLISASARFVRQDPQASIKAAGFALKSSLLAHRQIASQKQVSQWLVYAGLTPQQDAAARSWSTTRGYSNVQVEAHYGVDWFVVSLWVLLSLVVIGTALVLVVTWVLRDFGRELRPVLATLYSLGVPRSFGGRVLTSLTAVILGSALALIALACPVAIALLNLRYPSAFNPANGQWWLLAAALAAVLVAGFAAAGIASHRVRHAEKLVLL